jgi:hypothetical protein
MSEIGHFVYTSMRGYATILCDPQLEHEHKALETMAQGLVTSPGGFSIDFDGKNWRVVVVRRNGKDHVGRPRNLIHVAVLPANMPLPPIFSPCFLLMLTLEKLEHEDPGLKHRLPRSLRDIAPALKEGGFDKIVTDQNMLKECLSGEAKSLFTHSYDALADPDRVHKVENYRSEGALDYRLAVGLLPFWIHQRPCRLSNIDSGDTAPGKARLFIHQGTGRARRASISGIVRLGQAVLNLIAAAPQPQEALWLLHHIPMTKEFSAKGMQLLSEITARQGWPLDYQSANNGAGIKSQNPCLQWLLALKEVGGVAIAQKLLLNWRSQIEPSLTDEDVRDELDAHLAAATTPRALHNLLYLIQTEQLLH